MFPIYQPIAQVWTPEKYAAPDAPPSELALAMGHQLASRLQRHQGLYVSDHRAGVMLYVSEGVTRLLGHTPEAFAEGQYSLVHPDDQPVVSAITVLVNRYITQRTDDPLTGLLVSTDYRIRHFQGHYVRVLRQNIILTREPNGSMVGSAGILTDITHHKFTTEVRYHVNRPDFSAFARTEGVRLLPVALSAREQSVLALVLEGLTSQQISQRLGLSKATVSTHRRNITRKVDSHDPNRLLRYLDTEFNG